MFRKAKAGSASQTATTTGMEAAGTPVATGVTGDCDDYMTPENTGTCMHCVM